MKIIWFNFSIFLMKYIYLGIIYYIKEILLNPSIVPAPMICPKLVVANNSATPKPSNPKIDTELLALLVFIAYLPIAIASKLLIIMINDILIDHRFVCSVDLLSNNKVLYIFI